MTSVLIFTTKWKKWYRVLRCRLPNRRLGLQQGHDRPV
jgi:hypothetical protein